MRRRVIDLVLGAMVGVAVFPKFLVDIGTGLDYSWAAALHMGLHNKMAFGRDLTFTFGPLGFLTAPAMYYPAQGTLALLVRFPLILGVGWFVLAMLRRVLPGPQAVLLALPLTWTAATTLAVGGEAPLIPVALLGAAGLSRLLGPEMTLPDWVWAASGVACGLLSLIKFDAGLFLAVIGIAFSAADAIGRAEPLGRRRQIVRLGLAAGSLVVTLLVMWVLLRQPLGALPGWISVSWDLTLGYNEAMAATYGGAWEPVAAVVASAGLAGLLFVAGRGLPLRRMVALSVYLAFLLYVFAKQAFTRHDALHVVRFAAVVVLLAVVLIRRDTRSSGLLTAGLAVVMAIALIGKGSTPFLRPGDGLDMVGRIAQLTFSKDKRLGVIGWGRSAIPRVYPVPPTMVERINGHTVHIEPWEAVQAWVYPGWIWRPLPAFQSYSAYTPGLDRRNARLLASDRAPQFILAESASVDDRLQRWEPPESFLEFVCRYRIVETSDRWQLFERRVDGSACGAEVALGSARATSDPVVTPGAGPSDLVIARFSGVEPGALGRLRGLVLKPRSTFVRVGADPKAHRFVTATAGRRHVMVLPSCLLGTWGTLDTAPLTSVSMARSRAAPPLMGYRVSYFRVPYRC